MAQFPQVRVELPSGFDEDAFGGKALRARTRLALESAGLVDESLEYVAATKDLQGPERRDEMLSVTKQWVTVDPAASPPTARSSTRPARNAPTTTGPDWSTPAQRVRRLARPVEVAAWVLMVLSVVSGAAIAFRSNPVCSFPEIQCSTSERYPDLPLGLFLAFVGVVVSAAIALMAAYIRSRTEVHHD